MRALSQALEAVVLFAAVVSISLAGFLFAVSSLDQGQAAVEFGFAKSVLARLAASMESPGFSGFSATYPHSFVSVGYRRLGTNITVVVNGSIRLELAGFYALVAGVRRPIVQGAAVAYGSNETLAKGGGPRPVLYECYSSGWSFLVLDPSRLSYDVLLVNSSSGEYYIVRLTAANFTGLNNWLGPPEVYGQGYLRVAPSGAGDLSYAYDSVSSIVVYVDGARQELPPEVSSALSSGRPVRLVVVVRELGVFVG